MQAPQGNARTCETVGRFRLQTVYRRMVTIEKDKKSPTWIVTTTDSEGYHRQINLTWADIQEIVKYWFKEVIG
jgi:hypothetical protein